MKAALVVTHYDVSLLLAGELVVNVCVLWILIYVVLMLWSLYVSTIFTRITAAPHLVAVPKFTPHLTKSKAK